MEDYITGRKISKDAQDVARVGSFVGMGTQHLREQQLQLLLEIAQEIAVADKDFFLQNDQLPHLGSLTCQRAAVEQLENQNTHRPDVNFPALVEERDMFQRITVENLSGFEPAYSRRYMMKLRISGGVR